MYRHWKTGPNGLTRTCPRSWSTCSVSSSPWLLSLAQLLVSSLTSSQRNSFSRFDTLFDLQWPLTLNFQFETDNEKGCRIAGVSVTVGLNILFAVIGLFLKNEVTWYFNWTEIFEYFQKHEKVCILASIQNHVAAICSMVIFQAHRIYTYGVAAAYLQSTFSPVC